MSLLPVCERLWGDEFQCLCAYMCAMHFWHVSSGSCASLSLSMCTHTCMPIFKCICISIQYTVYSIQYTHTCTLTCTGAYSHVSVCLYSCYVYIYIRTHTRTLLWPESVNGSETGMGGATANRSRSRGKACDGERGEESEGHAGYLLTRVREESPLGTTNTLHHCR